MRSQRELEAVIVNWRAVVEGLNTLNEEEAKWCLDHEIANARRMGVLRRLYGRYSRMRAERELRELHNMVRRIKRHRRQEQE